MKCLTGLQRLTIDADPYGSQFSTHEIKLLALILEKIPCSNVKRLCFEIPALPTSPRLEEWHRIGEVLQQRGFPQLTELIFSPRTKPYEHIEKWIREELYMLKERRILSVQYVATENRWCAQV